MTIETKIAKNGTRLYYVEGKRVSRQIAIDKAVEIRDGKAFTVEYDSEQNHFYLNRPSETVVYTARNVVTDKFNLKIDEYHGFTVMLNGSSIRKFFSKDKAKAFAAKIEDAFISGTNGVKVTLDGTISPLPEPEIDPAEYAVSTDAQDAAIDAETELATAVNMDGATEIGSETIKFFNGKFYSVFSRKYLAGILQDALGIIHYCIFNDGDTEIYNVREHEVSYEEFISTLEQRGAFTDNEPEPPNAEIELANDDEPPVTAEDREEMNAAVRKFAQAMKDNYEQCRRAEQIKAQVPVVPLTGNITVDSGAKAFALVGEYFPNGLKFKCLTEDINGADKFTFTDGGEMFLNATCTPDNRRVEYLEVINTDYSAGKRKPLNVLIKPPAHVDEEHFFGQGTY